MMFNFLFSVLLCLFVVSKSSVVGNCEPQTDFNDWITSQSPPSDSSFKLLQSHVLIRHGSRMIAYKFRIWSFATII